jgi:FkbM family methyltransferase
MQIRSSALVNIVRAILPRGLRNAIRKPGTSVERLISRWKRFRGEVAQVEVISGWRVKCHPICTGEFGVFRNDIRQEPEMQCFARLSCEGMRFIDVGTHWGVFTLAALHFGGPQARVLGIEASDSAAKIYQDNLHINEAEGRVIVVNAACGDRVGELKMLTTGAGGADYFVIPATDRPDTITVPLVSVDHVVQKHSFQPTHLKIDVEGFEEEVLEGARLTLLEARPIIFLELHGDLIRQRGTRPEAVLEKLSAAGYTEWQKLDGSPLSMEELSHDAFNARFTARPSSSPV